MAVLLRTNLLKNAPNNVVLCTLVTPTNQKRGIYGKVMRKVLEQERGPRPAPYPWEKKPFYWWKSAFDHPHDRFDENSKVVVVEGPIGVGKTELAKKIADEFDMRHFPEPNMDGVYINGYGYDLRQLDSQLPKSCQSFDHRNFCKDPKHLNAANFQILMYHQRYSQYIDALAHILNTGQGVVLERSPFSDFVFAEAMYKSGFISKGALSVYHEIKNNTITDLLKPHLVIYLDIDVKTVQDRVKKRNLPYEQNSKALSDSYLSLIEKFYKQFYLKDISLHAELLVYDWTAHGDTEIVIEDIERMDFDRFGPYDPKMKDWRFTPLDIANDLRRLYTNDKYFLMNYFNVPRYDVPELMISGEDCVIKDTVYESTPGMRYRYGFNKSAGDTGLLFKVKAPLRNEEY